jgi:hypothetical protein
MALALALALAAPLGAETYSWIDDQGTYNFTEDFSQVPKKYRNKVRRRDDPSPEKGEASPGAGAEKNGAGGSRASDVQAGNNGASVRLFGGKTEEAWRSELNLHELELRRLEALLADQQSEAQAPGGVSRERLAVLAQEREETRTEYNRRYKAYLELLESARKAGFTVEMKK